MDIYHGPVITNEVEKAYKENIVSLDKHIRKSAEILGDLIGFYSSQPAVLIREKDKIMAFASYTFLMKPRQMMWVTSLGSFKQGYGKIIVRELEKITLQNDVLYIGLTPDPEARGFYEHLGFIWDDSRKFMRKRL